MEKLRKSGFYWIRLLGCEYEVAYYNKEHDIWNLTGLSKTFIDTDLEEIKEDIITLNSNKVEVIGNNNIVIS